MKRIHFTQEQITRILENIAQKEGGYLLDVITIFCVESQIVNKLKLSFLTIQETWFPQMFKQVFNG